IDRNHDVFLEQPGKLITSRLSIVRDDGGADMLLVLEQASSRSSGIRGVVADCYDVLPRPYDVVCPQLAQSGPERHCAITRHDCYLLLSGCCPDPHERAQPATYRYTWECTISQYTH